MRGGCGLGSAKAGSSPHCIMAASMCFVYSCALQLHGVLEFLLAKRIAMAA